MKDVHMVHHKCDECEHNAINESNLKRHIKSHHKDVETESKKRKITNDDLPGRKKLNLNITKMLLNC